MANWALLAKTGEDVTNYMYCNAAQTHKLASNTAADRLGGDTLAGGVLSGVDWILGNADLTSIWKLGALFGMALTGVAMDSEGIDYCGLPGHCDSLCPYQSKRAKAQQ